jgi:hypothetical protein
MSYLSILSVFIIYPITLLGDGCLLIAVALAATVGGSPITWGVAFALFHAVYGLIGIAVADEVARYSESLGDLFIVIGGVVLLKHFLHHTLHHKKGGDCRCENHQPVGMSTWGIISTASAFSLHSLASAAIVRGITSDITGELLILVMLVLSAFVGLIFGGIVYIGGVERLPILRLLDRLPGVVAAGLTVLVAIGLAHLFEPVFGGGGSAVIVALGALLGVGIGVRVWGAPQKLQGEATNGGSVHRRETED